MSKEPIQNKGEGELKSRLIKIAAQLLGGDWASDVAEDYRTYRIPASKVAGQAAQDAEKRRVMAIELRDIYDKMDSVLSDEKTDAAKVEIPDFLIEMSEQMKTQPNRMTAHPFWQVRCKRYLVTEEGYGEHHWVLVDDDGEFYRSDKQDIADAAKYFQENYNDWFMELIADQIAEANAEEPSSVIDMFESCFDEDELPKGVDRLFVQETEEVVSTHLTEHDAEWFIKRKQHSYPPLYTFVESAYWSPQLKQLQDWIISLPGKEGGL